MTRQGYYEFNYNHPLSDMVVCAFLGGSDGYNGAFADDSWDVKNRMTLTNMATPRGPYNERPCWGDWSDQSGIMTVSPNSIIYTDSNFNGWVSYWFRNENADNCFMLAEDDYSFDYHLQLATGFWHYRIANKVLSISNGDWKTTAEEWHHHLIQREGEDVTVYVDGDEAATDTHGTWGSVHSEFDSIGAESDGTAPVDGWVSDMMCGGGVLDEQLRRTLSGHDPYYDGWIRKPGMMPAVNSSSGGGGGGGRIMSSLAASGGLAGVGGIAGKGGGIAG